jgi:hypothetical protein
MTRRVLTIVAAAIVLSVASNASAQEFKLKLQGSAEDRKALLDKLNENGKEQKVSFVDGDTGFQYQVAIYGESAKGSDYLFGGGADASAAILNDKCEVLYIVTRGGRTTKGGAVNALSKELVKKFKAMAAGK